MAGTVRRGLQIAWAALRLGVDFLRLRRRAPEQLPARVSATLVDFNFKFILLRSMSEKADRLTLVPRSGIRIELQNTNKPMTTPGVALYAVSNWEELSSSRAFQVLLEDWIFEYNQGTKRPRRSRKKALA